MPDSSKQLIAVIGLGYVGLPLSLQFARCGVRVLGVDVDSSKVESLAAGRSYIKHIPGEEIAEQTANGMFSATTDFAALAEADAILICVPTPIGKHREPDLSYVLSTGREIAPHLKKGALVVLESTTYPGTTEDELGPVLEEGSGMVAGVGFHLAYSPEREDPANPESRVSRIPKVVGGKTEACLAKAVALYSQAVETIVPVSSCRVAEAAKLLENIFRSVNIALVNELKQIYGAMDIDIWEVIAAASTKPFGFMPFYPGPGLGGHCIPIDPFYLTWKAREHGLFTRFIELAGEINTAMPRYVIEKTAEGLNAMSKSLKGSKVLVVGLAYKPNVDDDRESPAYVILDLLTERGAEVAYYDPHIPEIGISREHAHRTGTKSVEWSEGTISGFDAAIIVTAHADVPHAQLAEWCELVIDTRNALGADPGASGTVVKA